MIQHERAVNLISTQAEWDDDTWRLKPLENTLTKRPHSTKGLRRPETEYARHRAQYDPDTRYKAENIVLLDLENIERTTQDYAGPDMRSHCQVVLETPLDQEDVYVEGSGPLIEVVDEELHVLLELARLVQVVGEALDLSRVAQSRRGQG